MTHSREISPSPPATFPVYGLDGSWTGSRWLDGFGDRIGDEVRWVRCGQWSPVSWLLDGSAAAARTRRFAGGWAACSDCADGVYLAAAGLGSDPDDLAAPAAPGLARRPTAADAPLASTRETTMTTAATALPLLGLRITAGPVELRGITDDLIGPLADLATKGIHDPDFMPFFVPWSLTSADELPRSLAQYHWGNRSRFCADQWAMDLAVFFDGELVGSQGFHARDFRITRIGETGSWLGREFQGRGIGTAMRKVICAFIFDHLDARFITSSAFADNPASLGVSRKCGYTENGVTVMKRMDKPATLQLLVLEPGNLARYEHKLTIEGLPEFRRSIGLDA